MDYSGRYRSVRPLLPQDDDNHPIEAHPDFNESRYIHLVDGQQRVGGWFRVGQRANRNQAELTVCLYLPDGQVGFFHERGPGTDWQRAVAGGLSIENLVRFERRRLYYKGPLHLLPRGELLEDPGPALRAHPPVHCVVDLELESVAPAWGGELLDERGQPFDEGEGRYFARAHLDQALRGWGQIQVGDASWQLQGYGLLDHSWGPRIWHAIPWYRWFPCTLNDRFAVCLLLVQQADGSLLQTGYLYEAGQALQHVPQIALHSQYDTNDYLKSFVVDFCDEQGRDFRLEGEVVNAVPCRHVRKQANGSLDVTRILESLVHVRCGEHVGWGLAEYLDHRDSQGRLEGRLAGW